jgi:hypothetical protein
LILWLGNLEYDLAAISVRVVVGKSNQAVECPHGSMSKVAGSNPRCNVAVLTDEKAFDEL